MKAAGLFVACFWLIAGSSLIQAGEPNVFEDYTLHCSACHTLDGSGTEGVVPSLRELAPLLEHPGARAYLVRVPGVAQAPLSDARIARLLNWVLAELSGTSADPPFGAAEVAQWRTRPLRDPVGFRAKLVAGLGAASPSP